MERLEAAKKVAIDPVCGMAVVPGKTKLVSVYKGQSFWFCAPVCRKDFEENPEKYLGSKSVKKKGWFRRYLDRMARANEKYFGTCGAKCH
jgi:YHS domain-containing protein